MVIDVTPKMTGLGAGLAELSRAGIAACGCLATMFLRSAATSLVAVFLWETATVAGELSVHFNRDVRPILSENCFHCHGADAAQRQADLRLDDRAVAVELAAIVPGHADESSLVERITSDDPDLKMPPPDSKRQLTAKQVELLTRWIAEGAEYKPHWAFQPVRRPELPAVDAAVGRGMALTTSCSPSWNRKAWRLRTSADAHAPAPD